MAKKILLIEYEPRYLDRIRGHLAGKDFDLVVAKDGEEGLEAYRRSRPDLVLISSVLPKLRTPDVIKGMQNLGGTPPILLMMSGYKGKNKQADAQRVGATSILEKPFSEEVFIGEINAALGNRPAEAASPMDVPASAPLLSADDIFSDVLSGMDDDEPRPAPAPGGTDPGIQKKLEQTLSGILPAPRRPGAAPSSPRIEVPKVAEPAKPKDVPAVEKLPTGSQTVKVDALQIPPAARPPERPATKMDVSVDQMLTDTLSGLKGGKPKAAEKPVEKPAPDLGLGAFARAPEKSAPKPEPAKAAPAPAPEKPKAPEAKPPRPEEKEKKPSVPSGPGGFGRYSLLEKIASGGMAEVFKARMRGEEGFEKIVAIKRILPHMADNDDFITMFIDEAKLAAQLTHNNIIHIYDLGKVDQYHYIAMEYVDGKDLRTIVKMAQEREYPLPPELALFIASKIANALDYAHRRVGMDGKELNLVHRDVSPQNILISFEGDIKLCDFGIAKAATKVSQTQTGALKGKLQYMSPEQAWGKKIDRRTDIFSLGIVLFEMLTGERLFTGDTDLTILEQVRDAKVLAPSAKNADVPKKVDQIVLKALAKSPQDRYQNASEMEKEINQVLYSYQPTPGPADLAIFMHRLVESQPAVSEEQIDAAFASAEMGSAAPEPVKKGKGLVISKKAEKPAEPAPKPAPAPAPVEVSSPAVMVAEPAKSRTGLYAGIGAAVAALAVAGLLLSRKGGEAPQQAVPTPAAPPATTAEAATATAAPAAEATAPPQKVVDPKAVEAEVKRLAAERQKQLDAQKAPVVAGKQGAVAPTVPPAAVAAAAVSLKPQQQLLPPTQPTAVPPPPTAAPPKPTDVPPRPTAEPVRVAEAAPKAAAAAEAMPDIPASTGPVKEGDLVGQGEGVVEPKLVKLGAFSGLPPQLRQMARGGSGLGTPVILALVTEKGTVTETRVLKTSNYKAVDEAAVAALKNSQITPATKNGVKVKFWKSFAITVKP